MYQKKLLECGVPCNLLGYDYLGKAIEEVMNNSLKYKKNFCKVYDVVAKEFGTTPSKAERSIRHSIEKAFNQVGIEDIHYDIFKNSVSLNKGKPTNSEFICTLAELLVLNSEGTGGEKRIKRIEIIKGLETPEMVEFLMNAVDNDFDFCNRKYIDNMKGCTRLGDEACRECMKEYLEGEVEKDEPKTD